MTDVRNSSSSVGANLEIRRKLFSNQLPNGVGGPGSIIHRNNKLPNSHPINIGAKARPLSKRPLLPNSHRPPPEDNNNQNVKAICHIAELWRQLRRQIQRHYGNTGTYTEIDDQIDRFHRALAHHCISFNPTLRRLFTDQTTTPSTAATSTTTPHPRGGGGVSASKQQPTQVLIPGRNVGSIVELATTTTTTTTTTTQEPPVVSSRMSKTPTESVQTSSSTSEVPGGIKNGSVPGLIGSFTRDRDPTLMVSLREADPNFITKSVNVVGVSLRTDPVKPVLHKNRLVFLLDSNENFINDRPKSKRRGEGNEISTLSNPWPEVNQLMSDIVQAALPCEPSSNQAVPIVGNISSISNVIPVVDEEDSQRFVKLVEAQKRLTEQPTSNLKSKQKIRADSASSSDAPICNAREGIYSSRRGKRRHTTVDNVVNLQTNTNQEDTTGKGGGRLINSADIYSSKRKDQKKKKKRKVDLPYVAGKRLSTWDPKDQQAEQISIPDEEEEVPPKSIQEEQEVPTGLEDELYEVETIREMMMDRTGKEWFLIKWAGYSESQNTWEPLENVAEFGDHGQRIDFLRRLYHAKLECSKYIMNNANYEWKPQSVTDLDLIAPMRQFNVSERQKRREGGSFYHEAQHWDRPTIT